MKAATLPKIERVAHGRVITLRKALKEYPCSRCSFAIEEGSAYYSLVVTGSGVNGRTDPERVHIRCLESKYSER
jgi:hypothetical protein